LQTVGELLRAARESQGLSIKDIEKATNIRSLYLEAIEQGNYDIIPGEVYVKGFIRNYAKTVGLDGQEMVNLYRQSRQQVTPTVVEQAPEPVTENRSFVKPLVAVCIIIVLLAGGWWLYNSRTTPAPTAPVMPNSYVTPSAPAVSVAPHDEVTPVAPPASTVQTTLPPAKPAVAPIQVKVAYSDACWTLVFADGKVIYEGTPVRGQTLTWEARQTMEIKFGNAAAVDLIYNGQKFGKLGNRGEVVVKKFSVNNGYQ